MTQNRIDYCISNHKIDLMRLQAILLSIIEFKTSNYANNIIGKIFREREGVGNLKNIFIAVKLFN